MKRIIIVLLVLLFVPVINIYGDEPKEYVYSKDTKHLDYSSYYLNKSEQKLANVNVNTNTSMDLRGNKIYYSSSNNVYMFNVYHDITLANGTIELSGKVKLFSINTKDEITITLDKIKLNGNLNLTLINSDYRNIHLVIKNSEINADSIECLNIKVNESSTSIDKPFKSDILLENVTLNTTSQNKYLIDSKLPTTIKHEVSFDPSNSGTINKILVLEGEKVTKPEVSPSKSGFNFRYWTKDDKEYDFDSSVSGKTKLIAYYEEITEEEPVIEEEEIETVEVSTPIDEIYEFVNTSVR